MMLLETEVFPASWYSAMSSERISSTTNHAGLVLQAEPFDLARVASSFPRSHWMLQALRRLLRPAV